ncbi:hypothetical protein BD770DRAFT_413156 [Pilaira anomala]|nr:hypothetical protein BD770DRAFT_413156 [Pilaira anomala]
MCHTSDYKASYYNPVPIRSPYAARRQVPNTYWCLEFCASDGTNKSLILAFNDNPIDSDFMKEVQSALGPYGVTVESVTLIIPGPLFSGEPSEIVIANQRDYLRAINLIPNNAGLYSPLRGIKTLVNKDEVDAKKSIFDSGYNSETSEQ